MEKPRCERCGKELDRAYLTHCSEKCLFEEVKDSKPFVPDEKMENQ